MSSNELPPNVTPIRPPPSLDIKQDGRPYTTPSAAVEDALRFNGFNEAVVGAGKIELRIIAEFEENGALFHHIQASHVQPAPARPESAGNVTPSAKPAPPAAPSATSASASNRVFRAIADATPELHYLDVLMASTVAEVEVLDQELAGATDEELQILVAGSEDEKDRLIHAYDCGRSHAIILRLEEES